MAMQVQKFVVAKVAGTKKGRAVIKSMLGDISETLLEAVLAFVRKYHDKEKATKLERCAIKASVKAIVLYQNKIVTLEEFNPLVIPSHKLAWGLVDQCELSMLGCKPQVLIRQIKIILNTFKIVMQPHVTGSTMKALAFIGQLVANEALLEALVTDKRFVKERNDIVDALVKLLRDLDIVRYDIPDQDELGQTFDDLLEEEMKEGDSDVSESEDSEEEDNRRAQTL